MRVATCESFGLVATVKCQLKCEGLSCEHIHIQETYFYKAYGTEMEKVSAQF